MVETAPNTNAGFTKESDASGCHFFSHSKQYFPMEYTKQKTPGLGRAQ